MNADNRYVRFDWAVKRMLRNLINNKKRLSNGILESIVRGRGAEP